MAEFEILGDIRNVETIAAGQGVYVRRHLERVYGKGRWRKMKGNAKVRLADGTICEAEIHWFEAHGIGRKDIKIKKGHPMSSFVICIDNGVNPASLILGKVYRALPDGDAETHGMLRVVDEDTSEPDGYLYPASIFAPVELPESAQRALMAAGG